MNYQIKTKSIKRMDMLDYMIHKIYKFLSRTDKLLIKSIINKGCSATGLICISTIVKNEITKLNKSPDEHRQEFIVSKIISFLNNLRINHKCMLNINNSTIVDIGGGNGNVLKGLKTNLTNNNVNPSKKQYVCVETTSDWLESYHYDNTKDITYMFWKNDMLEIETNSVDVILCMVSLHHMNDDTILKSLSEINRILKQGGIFLMKEHDCNTPDSYNYIKWEHYLYHILDLGYKQHIIEPNEYMKHSIDNFKSKREWRMLASNAGLNLIVSTNRFLDGPYYIDEKNATNLYWDIFIKR